jgi:P-aminobenzoate N-oxygenase AurF
MEQTYSYQATLAASEKIRWRVQDIIGGDLKLDFSKPFMPESLARVNSLTFLSADEKRILNQIRGNTYLCIFGVVEEFIVPFLMDHIRPVLNYDDYRTRALLQFAGEEAKHIQLFREFQKEFAAGFQTKCQIIGPASAIRDAILAHSPLSVALAILQIEWMTQRHYLDSIQDNGELDPQFKSLLRHHWMEEAQHAKLDTLMVEVLSEGLSREEKAKAVDEYLEIGAFIDGGLKQQVEFDLISFENASGRILDEKQKDVFRKEQMSANRWTYLGSGLTHPNFLTTVKKMDPELRTKIESIAPMFC